MQRPTWMRQWGFKGVAELPRSCRILASIECLLTADVLTHEGAVDNVGDLGIEPKESRIQRKLY